jgi:hypothetical protein
MYYSLLQFDLMGLPKRAESAVVYLYCFKLDGGGTPLYLDRIAEPWNWRTSGTGPDHDRLWWTDKPETSLWRVNQLGTPIQGKWYPVDITDLYNAWQNGTYPNNGLQFRPVHNDNNNFDSFYSGNYADDPALRPKLVVRDCRTSSSLPATTTDPSTESTNTATLGRNLEAPLHLGAVINPLAIYRAQGIKDIPKESLGWVHGKWKMSAYSVEGIRPKRKIEGVFTVFVEFFPPDAVPGPFFLIEEQGKYFVLTGTNFARVYGPVEKEEEVLPYARAYGDIFLSRFATLVTQKEGDRQGNRIRYPAGAPEVTAVTTSDSTGFNIRLVYYTFLHRACFYAIDIFVNREGIVKTLDKKLLKDMGGGVFF